MKHVMNDTERQRKLAYTDKIMGAADTVFACYRVAYLSKHITNHGTLLDVGCGAGGKIQTISRNLDHLITVGVDVSRAALTYAHTNNNKAHFIRGDAETLPIRSGFVDCVVAFDLLEHLPRPRKAMSEFYRVSRKGGILHSFVPCESEKHSIIGRSKIFRSLTMKHVGHIQRFTKQQIRCTLEDAGFTVIDEKHSYFHFAQIIGLLSYMFSDLLGTPSDMSEGLGIRFIRSFLRIFTSKPDLRLSQRLPNHSIGYRITARKSKDEVTSKAAN